MDSNQHQQFLNNPFIHLNSDPSALEEILKQFQRDPSKILKAQAEYNQFLQSNPNGFPKPQLDEQAYSGKFMMAADKSPTYMPLGKRKKSVENGCECFEFENEQRIAKIPKISEISQRSEGNLMLPPKPSTLRQRNHTFNSRGNNSINNVSNLEYQDFVADISRPPSPDIENRKFHEYREFPKKFDNKMIIGPYTTEVDLSAYQTINFKSAKIATRQLLALVFPSHILATHNLTGRPSPVGYENSIKMQLDTSKVEDIIHCIVAETNCKRQDVRITITAKCCETARLFKHRSKRNTI